MHLSRIACVVILCLGAYQIAAAQQTGPGRQLTGAELQSMLGKKWKAKPADGDSHLEITTRSSGAAEYVLWHPNGTRSTDFGVYRVKGDEICATWEKIRGGKELCFKVYEFQGRHIWTADGAIIATTTFVP